MGTSIIVFTSELFQYILAGLPYRVIAAYLGMLAIVSPFIWSSLLDYQKQRILTYFDSNVDPLGDGWNIAQSQTAIGSGGFFGKGYLEVLKASSIFIPEKSF